MAKVDLNGAKVVITGGSQGIGAELAQQFADAGSNVLVVARSEGKLAAVADTVGGKYLVADLGNEEEVDGLFARCVAALGSIDVWINNAGVETSDAFVNIDDATIRQLVRLNVEATMILTRHATRYMADRGSGTVVQISSVAGAMTFPGLVPYVGSKAAVTHFTEGLRLEMARTGVNFLIVSPGPVQTEMWDRIDNDDPYGAAALKRMKMLLSLPTLKPTKLAKAVVAGVAGGKRVVRLPRRYGPYFWLNNAPRRIGELALAGIDLTPETDRS